MLNTCLETNNCQNKPSFKGWDASRPIKTLHFLAPPNFGDSFISLMKEMQDIGEKEKFKVVCQTRQGFFPNAKQLTPHVHNTSASWLQDSCMIIPDKRMLFQDSFSYADSPQNGAANYPQLLAGYIKHQLFNPNWKYDRFYNPLIRKKVTSLPQQIAGGNIYQGKNKWGYNCVLMGKDCQDVFDMSQTYDIFKTNDVTYVPQADFHIDLFLRPLQNGKILVADDKLTIDWLNGLDKNLESLCNVTKEDAKTFRKFVKKSIETLKKPSKKLATTDEVIKALQDKRFEVVPVPGRLFEKSGKELRHNANFMNAIVQQRPDGSLSFITNKSAPVYTGGVDINGFFADYLKKACPEIKDIYFVEGKDNYTAHSLKNLAGGIHCRTMEEVELPQ